MNVAFTTPRGVDLASTRLNATGMTPSPNKCFHVPSVTGKIQPEFIHQVVLQQRLDEVAAAMHLQVRTTASFQPIDNPPHLAIQEYCLLSWMARQRVGSHEFGRLVDAFALLRVIRPIRGDSEIKN